MNRTIDPFEQLKELLGHWENGSDQTVRIFQDDATRTFHVEVGASKNRRNYHGDTLREAMASAYAAEADRY